MTNGRFIIVTGVSGAGKTTIVSELLKTGAFVRLVTCTTRAPRPGEVNGVAYHFLARAEFEAGVARGEFFESSEVYGNLYGSRFTDLKSLRAKGTDVIAQVDPQGTAKMKTAIPEAVIIFVTAPMKALTLRLKARRGLPESELASRIAAMEAEERYKPQADLVVDNRDGKLADAVKKIRNFLDNR